MARLSAEPPVRVRSEYADCSEPIAAGGRARLFLLPSAFPTLDLTFHICA